MTRGARSILRLALLLPAAVAALGCTSAGEDVQDLAQALFPPSPGEAARWAQDTDPDLRRRGTLLLVYAPFGGDEPYLRLYRFAAREETDPLVRAAGLRGLGRHGQVEDARLIADNLAHENLQVRWEAAKALQRIHAPEIVPDLVEVLRKPEETSEVRVAAADALGQYPEDRVVQALVAALQARELSVNLAARRSLATLTGQDLGLDPATWLDWYDDARAAAFADAREYRFRTYHRRRGWFEQLAFWVRHVEEEPGTPIGLVPAGVRDTYDEPPAEDGAPG